MTSPKASPAEAKQAIERGKKAAQRRAAGPSLKDIEKDMRGHGQLKVARDDTGHFLRARIEGSHQDIARFSEMYSGVRKLEIEHGAEENAKLDHGEIAARRADKLKQAKIGHKWTRIYAEGYDLIEWDRP